MRMKRKMEREKTRKTIPK